MEIKNNIIIADIEKGADIIYYYYVSMEIASPLYFYFREKWQII